jgi:exonuclease SbcC
MLIKSIKLENIRSYLNETIDFPEGSLLLSGDIGSGKSTILLAIEFALFGIRGKQLSGDTLLRNGKTKASVELKFAIDNKDVVIKRTLKKKSDAVSQEAGYIVVDGIKKDATAVELKTIVLDLLGYPKDLLSKTKNLIYRFTVYTPQEEMKHILTEESEERIDTLRKVFGIDKYKRINENADLIIKEIKSKNKEMAASIWDLEEKQKSKEKKEKEIAEINEKTNIILPDIEQIKAEISLQKKNLESVEQSIKKFNESSKMLSVLETELNNKLENRKRNADKIDLLGKEIESAKKEIKEIKTEDINIKEKENEIVLMRNTIKAIERKINEFNANKNNSLKIKKQILELDKCPTCRQDVSAEHKSRIEERENSAIKDFDEQKKTFQAQLSDAEKKLKQLESDADLLRRKETEAKINQIRLKNIKDKENEITQLKELQESIKKRIGAINIEKISLNKEVSELKDVQKEFSKQREIIDKLLENEKKLEIERAGFERERFQLERALNDLNLEIESKLAVKKKINKHLQMQNWLEKFFVNIVSEIEKIIMQNAHLQFNDLFEQWFGMLMEDETISIRLDENFAPVVQQNGYENSIENLSGGERTAAALAYRLALNQVINNMMTGIKTKDLIILDEPTDGFSSEQLDRVRDVLEQINAKQLIIVSHENKIESFVDKIIKVSKSEHISSVISG